MNKVKLKVVKKTSDATGSVVYLALNPKEIQTQQGRTLDADLMITITSKDPAAGDAYLQGGEYEIETSRLINS